MMCRPPEEYSDSIIKWQTEYFRVERLESKMLEGYMQKKTSPS